MSAEAPTPDAAGRLADSLAAHSARLLFLGQRFLDGGPRCPAAEAPGKPPIETLEEEIAGCTRCPLARSRTRTVPGEGHASPEILFVGEGPGAEEDLQGRPFVGRAGALLDRMIQAMGLRRADVFIANVVKCRPPRNRQPMADEMAACLPYLERQIELLQPRIIVALGGTALRGLFPGAAGILRERGRMRDRAGTPVMPTLHPAYLLRNPGEKRRAWEDLKAVLHAVGRPIPPNPADRKR